MEYYCYYNNFNVINLIANGIDYANSWNMNMDTREINGVDYTNIWSNSLRPAIDDKWFIHSKGNFPWSHFEDSRDTETKSAMLDELANIENTIEFYPNPFSTSI